MTVGGPDAFMPDAPAADTRIPLISDWSPNCCGEAPMKSAVRCVISDGAELDTVGSYGASVAKRKAHRPVDELKRNVHSVLTISSGC